MRVTLDARLAGFPGIGRFVTALWRGLRTIEAEVIGLWPRTRSAQWLGEHHFGPEGRHVHVRGRPFLPMEQVALPLALRRIGADVHHAPHFNLPYAARVPTVLTVHDLIAYRDPAKARSRVAGAYYRAALPLAVRRASVVAAVSSYTADEVADAFDVDRDRILVIEPGVDHDRWRPQSPAAVASVRACYQLPADYVLYVGTAKPHKNLATLVRALGTEHPELVLAGPTVEELAGAGIAPAHPGRVHALGRVSDEALAALYAGARALVLPSLVEGFGLTVLEAMACGTAVVASDGGALPETVGAAGIIVPATDVDAWSAAVSQIASDDALRARLVSAGAARVAQRTWTECARGYLDAYRDAMTGA